MSSTLDPFIHMLFLNLKYNRLYMYFYINLLSFFTWKKNSWVISLWAENAFILLEQICWYTDLQRKQNRTKKGKPGKTLSRAAHDDSDESYTEAETWRPHRDWPLPLPPPHLRALQRWSQRCSTHREQQTTWTRGKYVFSSLSI